MFSSTGMLVVTLMLMGFTWYLVLRHLYHIEINSVADSLLSIAWPLTLFGALTFASGFVLALNPIISTSVTTTLSGWGLLNADFTSELPTVPAFEMDGYEWKAGETKITFTKLPGDNHQFNYQLPGQKPQKLEGTTLEVPAGTTSFMVWRQRLKPGIASEVRTISPNK